jgi:hypothetical protein
MAHVSGSGFGNVGSYSKIGTCTFDVCPATSREAIQPVTHATTTTATLIFVLISVAK